MSCRFVSVIALFALALPIKASDWKPVDPAEVAEKTPKVEKDADAEIIFSDTRISDEVISGHPHWVELNYIRIKVYNSRGRDRYSTVNIPIPAKAFLSDIAARTIRSDGTIVDLEKDAIKETTSKNGNTIVKQKSFPMPAVEPGSIIEYRWRESHNEVYAHYVRLKLQRDIPARVIRYYIKPYASPNFPYVMAVQTFNGPNAPLVRQADGYYLKSVEDVPAFNANLEPRMPPPNELQTWSLIYYRSTSSSQVVMRFVDERDTDRFWTDKGKSLYLSFKPRLKVGRELREKAAEITAKATSPSQKLALLYEFCQRNIKNVQTDAVTAEEREEADKNKTPKDTLNQGMGTPADIQFLFAALTEAVGFDAHIALVPSRSNIFFSRDFADSYFLTGRAVAVKTEDGWRFFDPSATFVPNGMLFWRYEGVPALITDPKEPVFDQTPFSKPENNNIRNEGHFRVSEDGTLEGNIVVSLSGHEGITRKEAMQRQSEDQRQREFEKAIKGHLSTAEVTDMVIEHATDLEKPVIYKAHVRVPSYAQRTGKRLFFAPAVFQQGVGPRFPNKDRKYPIYFPFPWTEDDVVTISIPNGFEFETPEIPPQISFGDIGAYQVQAKIENRNRLVYTRKFVYGTKGLLLPRDSYAAIKARFDAVATSDSHQFTLKQTSAQTTSAAQ